MPWCSARWARRMRPCVDGGSASGSSPAWIASPPKRVMRTVCLVVDCTASVIAFEGAWRRLDAQSRDHGNHTPSRLVGAGQVLMKCDRAREPRARMLMLTTHGKVATVIPDEN